MSKQGSNRLGGWEGLSGLKGCVHQSKKKKRSNVVRGPFTTVLPTSNPRQGVRQGGRKVSVAIPRFLYLVSTGTEFEKKTRLGRSHKLISPEGREGGEGFWHNCGAIRKQSNQMAKDQKGKGSKDCREQGGGKQRWGEKCPRERGKAKRPRRGQTKRPKEGLHPPLKKQRRKHEKSHKVTWKEKKNTRRKKIKLLKKLRTRKKKWRKRKTYITEHEKNPPKKKKKRMIINYRNGRGTGGFHGQRFRGVSRGRFGGRC